MGGPRLPVFTSLCVCVMLNTNDTVWWMHLDCTWYCYLHSYKSIIHEQSSFEWSVNLLENCTEQEGLWILNPFASEAVYTRNFFSDRMSDSV